MGRVVLCYLLCLSVLWIALASTGYGQTAQLTGRITDTSSAVIPGAHISMIHVGTGSRREVISDDQGQYTVPLLSPGVYQITVQMPGFRTVTRPGIELLVQQVARVDFTLELGAIAEQVTVTDNASQLESETSALGKVVDAQRVQSLPLLGRNPYSLVALVPGARPSAGLNDLPVDQISTAFVSINGARGNQNEYLLDGAPNTAAAQNQPVIFANPDSVQEFKVETNSYSAQYGRAGGGVFNVVTKSGTNEWRGTLYDYLRNDVLNANNFFSNRAGLRKSPFRFNQFGATAGGPLQIPRLYDGRNRTFIFGSYEGVRFSQGGTYAATVPTLMQRAGIFTQPIFDPSTTRRDPADPRRFLRDRFPNDTIPRERWNAVAVRMLDFIPRPNAAGDPATGTNNYVTVAVNRIRKDTFSIRIDHNLNDSQRLSGRFSFDRTPLIRPDVYGNIASPTFGPQVFTRQNLSLDYTTTYSPTLVGTVLYSFTRLSNVRRPRSFGFDIASLGFPADLKDQLFPPSFPSVLVNGMGGASSISNTGTNSLLGGNDFITFGDNTHALMGHLTRVFPGHTVRFGGEARLLRPNFQQFGDTAVQFSFGPAFTQGPDPERGGGGSGFASFLLGVSGGSYTFAPALAIQHVYWAGFVQDDVKLTSRLTLNLGFRYEYESPRTERFNQLTNFDPQPAPPLASTGLALHGVLTFPGGGRIRGQWEPDRNNFSPRVGFAYQLTPKTVVRGGVGLFYAAITGGGGASGGFGVSGFAATTTLVTSLDGLTPTRFLDNPYPGGIAQPSGSRLGPATLLGESVRFSDRNIRTPHSVQWNLNVQRELPGGFLLELGYAGNRGLKLPEDLELNQLPNSALALGGALRDLVPNPFFGQITAGPLSSATVSRAQLLRPYPHFTGVVAVASTWATSNYHALLISANRRFRRGLTLNASYTFSKLLDQATGGFAGEMLGGGNPQDFYNRRADRSISSLDATHRFVVNGVWSLPFGPERLWRPTGFMGVLLGGWELSGIVAFQSGGPLGVISNVNTTFSQGGGQRPNVTGLDPRVPDGERSITRWINPAAFVAPPPYTFGNAPRTFSRLRSDGLANVDVSLVKNTRMTERLTLQFRSEFFNFLNTPRFAPPNTSFGNPLFGTVSNQANQPRVVQFALKLIY